ncbi:hypothetical protein CUMW_204420 [Citrus unshiu]|uniref:ENTH domain-containing protein n=1 Tax=Citrus unshiu TaxID=55188 RepID=A0A2H5Q7Y6_CITUN|nr:hypothetical protein CUMW_204420 [Citrus unshiu]
METLINQIKKQASGYLQEKYKTARLAFTDVSEAELLAEEATNNDPLGPDAKTMTKLAEASCDGDDYWRIVDVLHRRFNWGANMQKRAENILKLLGGGQTLKEARLKALRITNEIQGFGSATASPSSSTYSPSSSEASRSSFGSYSTTNSSITWNDVNDQLNKQEHSSPSKAAAGTKYSLGGIQEEMPIADKDNSFQGFHLWDSLPVEESGSLLDVDDDENEESNGLFRGICSKLAAISSKKLNNGDHRKTFRSFSDNNRTIRKRYDRQYSSKF